MPNNISLCIEFVAVVVLTRFLTDLVLVRRGAFLFDENAPDTEGVANKENRAVIQKKPDSGDIKTLDFVFEVSRVREITTLIAFVATIFSFLSAYVIRAVPTPTAWIIPSSSTVKTISSSDE